MLARLVSTSLFITTLTLLGCGDDAMVMSDGGAHADDHEGAHDHTSCGLVEHCMGTVELKDGLTVHSAKHKFTVQVLAQNALHVQDNDWVLQVSDETGAPVKNAKIVQDVFSVDCMHGGPKPAQHIAVGADGQCEIMPFHEHAGPWDTTLEITAGGVTDTATMHLCVPEADGDAG